MNKRKIIKKRDNIFRLKGTNKVYYDQQALVNFQLSEQSSSSESNNSSQSSSSQKNRDNPSIIPTFNNDRNAYTPSFYLPYKQIKLKRCMMKHQKKQEKYLQIDKQLIMMPKPRKRQYCHSCGCAYQDYLGHIWQPEHKDKVMKHPTHIEIIQLIQKFQCKYRAQLQERQTQKTKQQNNRIQSVSK